MDKVKSNITILSKGDIKENRRNLPIKHLIFDDFDNMTDEDWKKSDMVMFIAPDGDTWILKNRWGNKGMVNGHG